MKSSRYAVSFDGARIAYRVYGRGEPAVLLSNGIGCNQVFLDRLIRKLSAAYRIIIWDYRGHVDSDKPADPRDLTMDVCLRDMQAVVNTAEIGEVVLAGFSMGVQMSLEYLHRHPQYIKGLIALLGAYEYPLRGLLRLGPFGKPLVRTALEIVKLSPPVFQQVWRAALGGPWTWLTAKYFVLNSKAARRSDFENWRSHMAAVDFHAFLQLAISIGEHSAGPLLKQVKVPTLIVAGAKDNFTPIRVTRRMHEKIPGSEFLEVKGGTHGGLFEYPGLINPRVYEFMQRHFPR